MTSNLPSMGNPPISIRLDGTCPRISITVDWRGRVLADSCFRSIRLFIPDPLQKYTEPMCLIPADQRREEVPSVVDALETDPCTLTTYLPPRDHGSQFTSRRQWDAHILAGSDSTV